jgi:predicted metal-binding membrane protein
VSSAPEAAAPTTPALERLLRRERLIVGSGLALLVVMAWAWLFAGAGMDALMGSMPGMGEMPMSAMPGMQLSWSASTWALLLAMWWVMMIAMMTPSAAPTILLYARVQRTAAPNAGVGVAPTAVFAAGYLLEWLLFSLVAVAAQFALDRAGLLDTELMRSQHRALSAGLLLLAGVYQLSPLKNACLSKCRAPAAFLSQHWRPGVAGALRLGALHGAWCVGCCWLLMALLFVFGVMNMAWVAALAVLVMAEKLLPRGEWVGRAVGVLLLAMAALAWIRP